MPAKDFRPICRYIVSMNMQNESRQTKRIMTLMPGEEPVFLRTRSAQYSAKLVNISRGGALISILDCELEPGIGSKCRLFFSDGERMFGVTSEILRKDGGYAALRFVDLTEDKVESVAAKIDRMDNAMVPPQVIRASQNQSA
jgi:hypothetical protein